MPEQSDIEEALSTLLAAAFYPGGQPSDGDTTTPSPVIGAPVSVYRGWPVANDLDTDLQAGRVNVTIWPEAARNGTRYNEDRTFVVGGGVPSITATVSGRDVTLAGTGQANTLVGIRVGQPPGAATAVVRTTSSSTLVGVAAALAGQIPGSISSDVVVTIPGAAPLLARTMADVDVRREVGRSEQRFRVIVWAPSPALRDAAARVGAGALYGVHWLQVPNDLAARLYDVTSAQTTDAAENAGLFRRDFTMTADYPITLGDHAPEVLFPITVLAPPYATDVEIVTTVS